MGFCCRCCAGGCCAGGGCAGESGLLVTSSSGCSGGGRLAGTLRRGTGGGDMRLRPRDGPVTEWWRKHADAAPLRRGERFCAHHDPARFTGVRCCAEKKKIALYLES